MNTSTHHQPVTHTRFMAILGILIILVMLPVVMVIPVLKQVVQDRYHVGELLTALFMSVNMVGALIAAPLAGSWSDRLGRRTPLIVGGLLIESVLFALMVWAPNYATLMALRFLEGAAHIFAISLLLAVAADYAKTTGSGLIMGVAGGSLSLGIALGAPLAGILGRQDPLLPLWAGAIISLVAACAVVGLLREQPIIHRAESLRAALKLVKNNRALLTPFTYVLVERLAQGFFVSCFPLYLRNIHHQDPAQIGALMTMLLLPFALACYPFGWVAERTTRTLLLGGGSALYAVGVALVGLVPLDVLPWLMVILGLLAAAMFIPTLMLVADVAGESVKATAMGGFNSFGSVGFLLGPFLGGAITQWVGQAYTPLVGYRAAFMTAGSCVLICVLITLPMLIRVDRGELKPALSPSTEP